MLYISPGRAVPRCRFGVAGVSCHASPAEGSHPNPPNARSDSLPLAHSRLGAADGCVCRVAFKAAILDLPSRPFEFRENGDIRVFWQTFLANMYPVCPSDRVILDVGANIGALTLYALLTNHNCHVISVEPAPDSCDRLRAVVSLHAVSTRCTIVEAALSSQTGMTTIQMCPGSQFRQTGKDGVPVPSMTLDDVIATYDRVDLLKLDVQGAEYPALAAASLDTLQRIRRIEMEYHPFGNVQELFRHLEERGFSLNKCHPDPRAPGYGMASLSRSD